MNMKNIFKIGIVTLSLAMGLSSCNDFFDSIPGETYDMEGTFSNRSKTMEFLNNVYSYVNNENSERFMISGGSPWTAGTIESDITWDWHNTNEWTTGKTYASSGWVNVFFIENYKGMIVSKCPCFINKDTELITAYQIMKDIPKSKSINDYEEYLSILEKHGLKDARIQMENMCILDYLIMNEDRHLNNFGIIRDVNSLEWINVAPIFDNGESLNITYYSQDELCVTGEGRFFYQIKPFDEIIKVVRDIKRLDLTKLDGIVEWYDDLLHMYQYTSGILDERINKLCILLNRQIKSLKKLQSLS